MLSSGPKAKARLPRRARARPRMGIAVLGGSRASLNSTATPGWWSSICAYYNTGTGVECTFSITESVDYLETTVCLVTTLQRWGGETLLRNCVDGARG